MLTITEDFLKMFPKWAKAGWAVGDKINLLDWLSHPPKKPGS